MNRNGCPEGKRLDGDVRGPSGSEKLWKKPWNFDGTSENL